MLSLITLICRLIYVFIYSKAYFGTWSVDQPLASSTQQQNSQQEQQQKTNDVEDLNFMSKSFIRQSKIDQFINSKENIYQTTNWTLKNFSRCCEKLLEKEYEPSNTNTSVDSSSKNNDAVWETWSNQSDQALVVRLAGFGHLCILFGSSILQAYFLILSRKWMKAVIVGDEVMLLVKQSSQTNRLRLTFQNENDANSFYTNLSHFVNTNLKTDHQSTQYSNTDNFIQTMENVLNSSSLSLNNSTEWPIESLEGLIRLCLADPNFPGFVKQIDKIMKKLTRTIDSV